MATVEDGHRFWQVDLRRRRISPDGGKADADGSNPAGRKIVGVQITLGAPIRGRGGVETRWHLKRTAHRVQLPAPAPKLETSVIVLTQADGQPGKVAVKAVE